MYAAEPSFVERWPTPDTIDVPTRICRCIFFLTIFPLLGLLVMGMHIPAVIFSLVAALTFVLWVGGICFRVGYEEAAHHAAEDRARSSVPVPEVDPAAWSSIPLARDGCGYLYVIRFETGVVKVGRTNHPSRRIGEHRRDAFAYNVVMTDVWVSEEHLGHLTNEVELITYAHSTAGRMRREYFHGADFRGLAEYAHALVQRV